MNGKTDNKITLWDKFKGYLAEKYGNLNIPDEISIAIELIFKVVYKIVAVILDIIVTLLLIVAITGIIVVTAFAIYISNYIDPTFDEDLIITSAEQTSELYYMDYTDRTNRIGTAVKIEDQVLAGDEYSIWADYSSLPEDLINAFVSIEDERFWSHNGVDWFRTVAAAANEVLHLKDTFGGSTITQQLVKNSTGDDDFTIQRKVQEILRAINVESLYSKEEIITMYLNIISFSQNCTGVQSAAYTYFGKDVSELTLIECAALAAIAKSPYYYDPINYPENNKERRQDVLDKMLELGYITQAEYDEVYYADLELYTETTTSVATSVNTWYTDAVIEDIIADYAEQYDVSTAVASLKLYTAGWKIYTVMDPDIQTILEQIYLDDSYFADDGTGILPESAAVIMDPYTGDILALVGGRGEKTASRVYNRATQATRPCGSSIKPLSVYAPALEEGIITWSTVYDDTPVNFGDYEDVSDAVAWPKNNPNRYAGLTTVYDAITVSKNTVAVKVLQDLGIDESFEFLSEKLHFTSIVESYTNDAGVTYTDKALSPLALGQFTYGVTVREMTAGYQIFANSGLYNESRTYLTVTDSDGNVVLSTESSAEVVISAQNASIMTKMLEGVVDTGTAKALTLKSKIDVAGKTGTTTADYDRWFIGYTPYYLCGVWFGYDQNQTLSGYSTNPAMLLWDEIMTQVHQEIFDAVEAGTEELKTFEVAAGVVQATYCLDSGDVYTSTCAKDPRGSRSATGYFTTETVPTEDCETHVLVLYDSTTGGVASQYCNENNLVEYALIRVEDRSFPIQVTITDAQYVYRELSSNVKPSADSSKAFFENMLATGEYCGTSGVSSAFNRFCSTHYDYTSSSGIDFTVTTDEVTTEALTDEVTTDTSPPETTTSAPTTETPTTEAPTTETTTEAETTTDAPTESDTTAAESTGSSTEPEETTGVAEETTGSAE
ncbi:MAG: transglycosylase domain-containing protein [Clostridia bacterium]|nr:transglycosylase domain-containing protein [Clostridia bacterium]